LLRKQRAASAVVNTTNKNGNCLGAIHCFKIKLIGLVNGNIITKFGPKIKITVHVFILFNKISKYKRQLVANLCDIYD
jgi:hypothetical protein